MLEEVEKDPTQPTLRRENTTYQFLNGANTGKSPQVAIRDLGELLLDGFQAITSNSKTIVGTVKCLGLESCCDTEENV